MQREKDIAEAIARLSAGDPKWDWVFVYYEWRDAIAAMAEVIAAVMKSQRDRIEELEKKLAEKV